MRCTYGQQSSDIEQNSFWPKGYSVIRGIRGISDIRGMGGTCVRVV